MNKQPMFKRSHSSIGVGDYLRNTGNGAYLLLVTKRTKEAITAVTAGHTGGRLTWHPPKRPRTTQLKLNANCRCKNRCRAVSLNKYLYGKGWEYDRVVPSAEMRVIMDKAVAA